RNGHQQKPQRAQTGNGLRFWLARRILDRVRPGLGMTRRGSRQTLVFATCVIAAAAGPVAAQIERAPRYAGRIVGVYDERTGIPIDSAEVRDMMSGLSASLASITAPRFRDLSFVGKPAWATSFRKRYCERTKIGRSEMWSSAE